MQVKFKYPVYNPCIHSVDVARDWGINSLTSTEDRELALSQPYKVAAIRVFYDKPWIHSYDPIIANIDVSEFDLVLISDIEYYSPTAVREWIASKKITNYLFATSGLNANDPLNLEREIYRPWWVRRFLECNMYTVTEQEEKSFMFDMLLGARRPHRDYAMLAMTQTGLLNSSIVTYRDCFVGEVISEQTEEFLKMFKCNLNWPYVSPNLDPAWEVSNTLTNSISSENPVEIFKRTYFSVVCETLGTGTTFFLSEKTIKAIFNNRMFLVFAGPYYLEQLRQHGFRTFDPIINESYDTEVRDFRRYNMIMHELMQLAWFSDPQEILKHTKENREHNRLQLVKIEEKRIRDQQEMLFKYIPVNHWLF